VAHHSSRSGCSKQLPTCHVWTVLRPFFSLVLVADAAGDSGSSGGVGAACVNLCLSQLLCLSSSSAAAAELVLPFVVRQLLLWRVDTAANR
jgi:hypothetical protein